MPRSWLPTRGWSDPSRLWQRLGRLAGRVNKKVDLPPEDALEVAQNVLAWNVRKHGNDSRFAVNAMWEVADRLEALDRPEEALVLRRQVWEKRRDHYGAEDLRTLNAEERLVALLSQLGLSREAVPHAEHVADQRQSQLGEDHRDTERAQRWLRHVGESDRPDED